MWFCEGRTTTLSYNGRSFQKVLSILPVLNEYCFVFKYGFWECPNFYIECYIEMWGKIIIFSMSICKGTLFSTVFVFSALHRERSTVNIKWFWDRRTLCYCQSFNSMLIYFSVQRFTSIFQFDFAIEWRFQKATPFRLREANAYFFSNVIFWTHWNFHINFHVE